MSLSVCPNSNVAAQFDDKYALEVARLEEIINAKNREIEALQSNSVKAATPTQIEELNERCKMLEQQKGGYKITGFFGKIFVASQEAVLDCLGSSAFPIHELKNNV